MTGTNCHTYFSLALTLSMSTRRPSWHLGILRLLKQTKKTEAPASDTPSAIAKPSGEFDLSKFKSKQAATVANVETLPSALPVHNMAAAKDFVRLHPNEAEYWSDELCFVRRADQGPEAQHAAPDQRRLGAAVSRSRRDHSASVSRSQPSPMTCSFSAKCRRKIWTTAGTITNLEGCEKAKTLWTKATSRKSEGVESYKITLRP